MHTAMQDMLLNWGLIAVLPSLAVGCSPAPKLTAQDRRNDISFLARWANEYSPFVELNEQLRGLPSYQALAPRYMQMAAEAKSDAEFYEVVFGYFSLLGVSGHGQLFPEQSLRGFIHEARRRPGQLSPQQLKGGVYWAKLEQRSCFVHPPFRIIRDGEVYRVGQDWRRPGRLIPQGTRISRVNGLTPASYLARLRKETWVRYIPRDTDWIAESLLSVHEGEGFRGWQVGFLLADETACEAFVPCRNGLAGPTEFSDYGSADGNCVCLELADQVGYIRVKCMGGAFIEKDGRKIRKFLESSQGKYRKLIIDVRDNGGGLHYYAFDNLIAPFLRRAVTYAEVGGIRRQFLDNHEPAFLEMLRRGVSIFAHETKVGEIKPPEGWDSKRWVFYRIERRVEPRVRYNFLGRLFILMNGGTGSAADEFVNVAQRIELATLVGRRTPGSCGPYFNPILVRLPASGMIFQLEADLTLNKDGSVEEIAGTKPDIEFPSGPLPQKATREELLRDKWIQRVVAEL